MMRLGRDAGEGCSRLHDELFHGLRCSSIELDEAWSFVMKKQKRLAPGDPPEYGDEYAYLAMDSDAKALVAYLVGKRNDASTAAFALDLRSRVRGRPQLTSDGFQPYVKAVAIAFGRSVDYAMLVKLYTADCSVEAKRRYSPGAVVQADKVIVFGDPDLGRIVTAHVERQNLTLRMLTRRFTRLTNGFSKTLRNHAAAMDLYVGYYNLCRVHESLGTTPAVAVRAVGRSWPVAELVKEALARSDPDNPPARSGSVRYQEIVCRRGLCAPAGRRG
ncbi:MAG: transposase [Deltaproteobacteria bacterium]|nr:transposase [Deltaproteobacteria bacterium]